MNANLAALLYLVSGVLFILALRGLSSPESSRRGNMFGMIGMVIAILTTLSAHPPDIIVAPVPICATSLVPLPLRYAARALIAETLRSSTSARSWLACRFIQNCGVVPK